MTSSDDQAENARDLRPETGWSASEPGTSGAPPVRASATADWASAPRRRHHLGAWRPILMALFALVVFAFVSQPWLLIGWGIAQEPRGKSLEDELSEASAPKSATTAAKPSGAPADAKMPSLLDLFWASGAIGLIISLSSMVAFGFVVEHAMTIRHSRLIPPDVIKELDRLISSGQIEAALEFVRQPQHDSLVSEVVRAGLERYRNSEFGFAEYRAAVEEAGEEYTSKLYRKTEALNVIGAVAPMLGLLGTVQGMILAFNTIAAKGGLARPDELAGSISLALVTTFEGLVVAIPAMVAFSFFRNRIDSLVAEAGKRVEQLMLPLGRQRGRGTGN